MTMETTAKAEPQLAHAPVPPPRKHRRWLGWLLWLAALLVCGLAAALGWLMMQYPNRKGPGHGRVVEIDLAPGNDLTEVAAQLAAAGALAEPQLFALHARLRGAAPRLRSGKILVYDSMSPRDLLSRIADGYGSAQLRVVIPEGFSRFEIATRLERWRVCERTAFLAATADAALLQELHISAPSVEGWLFPDTYLLRERMEPSALIRRFVGNAQKHVGALLAEHADAIAKLAGDLGWGVPQVLTLASIVEREAAAAGEQPVIAGVFLNRLRDPAFSPKRLQADPTVAYGCTVMPQLPSCAQFDGRQVTRTMLVDPTTPYNTYRLDGLPPGPIANPGMSAVRAVLEPSAHDYFYFVAKGGGLHAFSHSLEDHNAAVSQHRASPESQTAKAPGDANQN
jgi:UPF0755 protein